jgi:GT2 family glycosyltransferase
MAWEPDAIIRLLKTAKEKNAKVVSGLTFMHQKGRVVPHAYAYVPHNGTTVLAPYAVLPTNKDAFTVEAVGGACLLVHRDVYESVRKMMKGTTAYYWQEEVYSPKSDDMKGEDLVFSERMRAAGFDIWYEPRAIFMHQKKNAMVGIDDYINFLDKAGIPHTRGSFIQGA